ncbi:MAG: hypothetical protein E6Q97_37420 [Desulfurellales bacterium]|nr:MAG: hypothetical protein E6Q97_37420 [Desulfurellales bacterium]
MGSGVVAKRAQNRFVRFEQIKKKPRQKPIRYEEQEEMEALAAYLDGHPAISRRWFHPPNEGKRTIAQQMRAAKIGLKSGVPDVLIMRPCERDGVWYSFVAIELKRQKKPGRRDSRLSDTQLLWFIELAASGGLTFLAHGYKEALDFLARVEWL